jgi:hypothetical protein
LWRCHAAASCISLSAVGETPPPWSAPSWINRNMAIEFRCEKCDKKLKVKDELAGKRIKCPGCQAATPVPVGVASKQELDPDLNSSEAIVNLNLKKFKGRAIDLDEDEDFHIDELEGAVVLRKKREQAELAGPPKEPLTPMDWVFSLLFAGFFLVYPIVLLVQGHRSRGLKTLMLSFVPLTVVGLIVVLSMLAVTMALR